VKNESPEEEHENVFSPETKALIKGLSDSPESLQLKAEILSAANELKRGVMMCKLKLIILHDYQITHAIPFWG
jgi:hypothetical protein